MSIRQRALLLLLCAAFLPWLGTLQALPHHHVDAAVPQEELACSASGPSSQDSHLHGAGRLVAVHQCLACMAGSTVAGELEEVAAVSGDENSNCPAAGPKVRHSRSHSRLFLSRGPPNPV